MIDDKTVKEMSTEEGEGGFLFFFADNSSSEAEMQPFQSEKPFLLPFVLLFLLLAQTGMSLRHCNFIEARVWTGHGDQCTASTDEGCC